jgi:hypothetical protein
MTIPLTDPGPQTSQSAVSRVSQPADCSPSGRVQLLDGLPIGKSAIQQVGKPAVRLLRTAPARGHNGRWLFAASRFTHHAARNPDQGTGPAEVRVGDTLRRGQPRSGAKAQTRRGLNQRMVLRRGMGAFRDQTCARGGSGRCLTLGGGGGAARRPYLARGRARQ